MYRGLTYLLLFAFSASLAGYLPMLGLHRMMVQREIRLIKSNSPKALKIIRIRNPERDPQFQRIHKGEFRYKGKMYDIISESGDGSTITYLCYHDKREDNIFKSLRKQALDSFNSNWWNYQIQLAFPVICVPDFPLISIDFMYPIPVLTADETSPPVLSPPPEQA